MRISFNVSIWNDLSQLLLSNRTIRSPYKLQYTEIFIAVKMKNFQQKKNDIFLILAQNIDCGYTLEPPRRGGSNEYPQSIFEQK